MMKNPLVSGALIALLVQSSVWAKVGGGDIVFKADGSPEVVFSHDMHVAKQGMKCVECHQHYTIAKMSKGAKMDDIRPGTYCGACHDERRAFGVKGNCRRCHRQ